MGTLIGIGKSPMIQHGALLNQVDPPTDLALTVISDTQINLAWIDNEASDSFVVQRSLDGLTWADIATPATNSYNNTGLESYTKYYYRVKSVKGSNESAYSDAANATTLFYATLTATGTGTGVSTLRLEVSENQTLEITSGNARFYTDAAGTLNESTTWAVTTGAVRTIYLKAASGSSYVNIPIPDAIIGIGKQTSWGYETTGNSPKLVIRPDKLINNKNISLLGIVDLTGDTPEGLTYVNIQSTSITANFTKSIGNVVQYLRLDVGNNFKFTFNGNLTPVAFYIRLNGNALNYTGLDISGSGNLVTFDLINYRTDKMSSADMVTILTSLTNRTGTLPSMITINDYADYASPPQAVTDAVAALKIAKSITTVNLGA